MEAIIYLILIALPIFIVLDYYLLTFLMKLGEKIGGKIEESEEEKFLKWVKQRLKEDDEQGENQCQNKD